MEVPVRVPCHQAVLEAPSAGLYSVHSVGLVLEIAVGYSAVISAAVAFAEHVTSAVAVEPSY